MKHDHDVVDGALEALRSGRWTGNMDPQLEEKLMAEFDRNKRTSRLSHRGMWAAGIAAFLLGGTAFAAAGGVGLIKSLFVTVEIEGEQMQVELQPVGENAYEGTLDTQTQDGVPANIHVRQERPSEDEKKMYVHVSLGDGDAETEDENVEINGLRKEMQQIDAKAYSLDDLGDAEPVHTWTNGAGDARELYLIPAEESGRVQVFSVTTPPDGETTVRLLTRLPTGGEWLAQPKVEVDENDLMTLTWDNGDGQRKNQRVVKLIDRTSNNPDDVKDGLSLEIPGTQIKVKVNADGAAEEAPQ